MTLEPGLVFINSATMETSLALSLLPSRVAAMLATGFGVIGTLLAGIGLYGVIAFSVARRTREIGVRVAIGADRRDVLRSCSKVSRSSWQVPALVCCLPVELQRCSAAFSTA